jgi:hypothetical protein
LLHAQREVLSGRMRAPEFEATWGGRQVGGVRVTGDARRLVAIARAEPSLPDVRYRRPCR